MLESFWSAVAPAVIVSGALSLLVESLLRPKLRPFWRRRAAALAMHGGLWLLLLTVLLLVLQRPVFAATALLAGLLFVVLVSNAKYQALREPFIFQDFEYFSDALKHPRLYLPFLGTVRAVLAVAAFAAALVAGLALEESLLASLPADDFLTGSAVLATAGILLMTLAARAKPAVTLDAASDLRQLGLLTALWRYGEEELAPWRAPRDFAVPFDEATNGPAAISTQPHLVVVQSESFFDARRLYPGIRSDLLREFDALQATAACRGQVEVAAWGANTVRTEFAFLSGLAGESLGIHRFNPYRRLAAQGIATLASFLQHRGYRTVCVHPYSASFYSRDRLFPRLGFDQFIDIRGFAGAARSGPYVGDLAVAEKVCCLLHDASEQPLFVLVITMENHGPLHLEKLRSGDVERLYSQPPPGGCDDLTIYLRHLGNADRMAGRLRAGLEAVPRAGGLCWFGDHVPIMPGVYRALGEPGGQTDYFIWRKGGSQGPGVPLDLKIEDLGRRFLQEMGLLGSGDGVAPSSNLAVAGRVRAASPDG